MKHIIFDCDGTLLDTQSVPYSLFPGIREFLEIHGGECTFYIWTARRRSSLERYLKELGIFSYFSGISTPDDSASKPDKEGVMALVGEISKKSICVIGDSPTDMLGAKDFGVMAIGATWNKQASSHFLTEAGADFIVSHPSECSKLIELHLKGDDDV
jgi:phosphoglycolate phosphatase